jgi:hypothetical protein
LAYLSLPLSSFFGSELTISFKDDLEALSLFYPKDPYFSLSFDPSPITDKSCSLTIFYEWGGNLDVDYYISSI